MQKLKQLVVDHFLAEPGDYDAIQENPESVRGCCVWETFENINRDKIAEAMKDLYESILEAIK